MIKEAYGLEINTDMDSLLDEQGYTMLTDPELYKREGESSPQEIYARVANCFSFGDKEFAKRILSYLSKKWFMAASPIVSNAIDIQWPHFEKTQFKMASDWLKNNVTPDGLPISCFKSCVPDTKEGLVKAATEQRWMSMMGGGVGIIPALRSPDDKSTGVMAHMATWEKDTLAYRQSKKRRGSASVNLKIDHPEIDTFIKSRDPASGGDVNKKCLNINICVLITDEFMDKVIKGEEYELIDPKHGKTGRFLKARTVWEDLMNQRYKTGEPYILFIDTVNRNKPEWITNPNYHISGTNLCSEVTLYTSPERSAVCCLSSVNDEEYDAWKDTEMIADLVRFLDNVLEYFIVLAPKALDRAIYSASQERAIGIGEMGFHAYLQKHMIPFESGGFNSAAQFTAVSRTKMREQAIAASKELAKERGEAPDCKGGGMRNSTLFAIAPNGNSADILGTSPSREPFKSNAYVAEGRAGSFIKKNKFLERELEKYGMNTHEVWNNIMRNEGSVQHLNIPEHTRKVFKTFREIDMMWVIEQASIAQPKICQSISLNIAVRKNITLDQMSDIHMKGFQKGVKAFYYCRAQGENIRLGTGGEEPLNAIPSEYVSISFNECLSCEG